MKFDEALKMDGEKMLAQRLAKEKAFKDKETSLLLRFDKQMSGIYNHLGNLRHSHRTIETNSRRARGHLEEAIRLSLKLRRLFESHK